MVVGDIFEMVMRAAGGGYNLKKKDSKMEGKVIMYIFWFVVLVLICSNRLNSLTRTEVYKILNNLSN